MKQENSIVFFNQEKVRRGWDEEKELWYFSIVDVIEVLTDIEGYSKEWINQRLKSIEVRKELTDEWENRGVKEGLEFAILTNEITEAWAGLTTKQYKQLKGLKKQNLRDNMTNLELVLFKIVQ